MLGDVRDPQLVGPVPPEVPPDQVGDGGRSGHRSGLAPQRQPGQAGPVHQQRHRVAPDGDVVGVDQLGADPRPAVRGPASPEDRSARRAGWSEPRAAGRLTRSNRTSTRPGHGRTCGSGRRSSEARQHGRRVLNRQHDGRLPHLTHGQMRPPHRDEARPAVCRHIRVMDYARWDAESTATPVPVVAGSSLSTTARRPAPGRPAIRRPLPAANHGCRRRRSSRPSEIAAVQTTASVDG